MLSGDHCPRISRGLFFGLLLQVASVQAAPYRPASDDVILERLPPSSALPAVTPQRPELAAVLARRQIELARREADPRYLGYAQRTLTPWWDRDDAPTALLVLRATIRQSRHEFDAALRDLDLALARGPDAQASLTRATLLRVRGELPEALAACDAVGPGLPARICRLALEGQTGALAASYPRLQAAPPRSSAALLAWGQAELADMAERLGRDRDAERHYRTGLALYGDDHLLRAAYADWLLARQRSADTLALLAGREQVESLQLRRAVALQAQQDPAAEALRQRLAAGFALQQQRGEGLHGREYAYFLLALQRQPQPALAAALDNWQTQRELADARLVVTAARAAGTPQAAAPVWDWARRQGLEDPRLEIPAP
jgi:hypothetical protein